MRAITLSLSVCLLVVVAWAAQAKAAEDNHLIIKDLKVLIVVYRGAVDAPPDQRIDDQQLAGIQKAIECGRLFYFRNTYGRLNLSISYLLIDTEAPDNSGPSYEHIEADLRARGVRDNQYDGLFTTGLGMSGNWGGFMVLGKTGAAFGGGGGGGQLVAFPSADETVWYDEAWTFLHEFQHALDLAIAGPAGFHEFMHGHPYADLAEEPDRVIVNPGAQHWDWEASTLRNFTQYIDIYGATGSVIIATDTDGDGLANRNAALPMDEDRFGSDPTKPDTDGDGLDDLAEFCADIYVGSNPTEKDSDGDGIPDGRDKWPTVAIRPTTDYAYPTPILDGHIDSVYQPLIDRWYATNWTSLDKQGVAVYACWDEETLYLAAKAPAKFSYEMQIDTSADNGFWAGGDTYFLRVPADGQPTWEWAETPGLNPGKAAWGTDAGGNVVMEVALPARIGQGWSREINYGGKRLPEDVADGLLLLGGREVSFNIALDFPETRKRVLFTPTWTMISTTLDKDIGDADLPLLRYTKAMQHEAEPVARVDGVRQTTRVTVVNEAGAKLGSRMGSGEVRLKGVTIGHDPVTGRNVIIARTSTKKESRPFDLVVDASAQPPVLREGDMDEMGRTSLVVEGEPGANVTVEYQVDANTWIPVASAALDEKGRGMVPFDLGLRGFRGEYFETDTWTEPVFYRTDREIRFDYNEGSPVKDAIDTESFSVRWTGFMKVDAETKATFFLSTDDGSRLWIDGKLVVDHWGHHGKEEKAGEATLAPGVHELRIDYYEEYGWAAAHLEWQPEGGERTYEVPVVAFKSAFEPRVEWCLRARQVDVLGNASGPSAVWRIKAE
ncbi:MAG: hypothetical protein JW889_13725 [Verrucomicrobia bacterium]|nr:hypothetical protein [Verrucomicrobiota bacterium]